MVDGLARVLPFIPFLQRRRKLADTESNVRTVVVTNDEFRGAPGTSIFSGQMSEEYLATLTGTARADVFDKMRRSDYQAIACLSAVMNPILRAKWEVREGEGEFAPPEAERHAAFIKHVLFHDMDLTWRQFLEEALGVVAFGHSVFERVNKTVIDHPEWGTYTGLRGLFFRSQRTLWEWHVDPVTGSLVSVRQVTNGDVERDVVIPAEFLLVLSLRREGANYEGISMLRPCYGNWFRKDHYLKMNAIGVEKFAVPTPVVSVPAGVDNAAISRMEEALKAYLTHQRNYLIHPAGWEVKVEASAYDPSKVEASIDAEDKRMVKAFLANFLELGMNSGGGGSYALSFDLSDFFLSGLEHIAAILTEEINRKVIPHLIQANFGPQACYPQLVATDISDRAGEEFAKILQLLIAGGAVSPDEKLETSVRKRYNLPEADLETRRKAPAPEPFGSPGGGQGAGPPARKPGPAGEKPDPDAKSDMPDEGQEDDDGAPPARAKRPTLMERLRRRPVLA